MVAAVVIAVGLIVAIPLSWNAMVITASRTRPRRSPAGSTPGVPGGHQVTRGLHGRHRDPELAMARYLNNEIPQEKTSILGTRTSVTGSC